MAQIESKHPANTARYKLGDNVTRVGIDLVDTLGRVLADVPGSPYRPQQLAKHLVLNKDLTSRLVRALKKSDPLEALHYMPGPAPLRKVLASATDAGVSKAVIERAATAVEAFDELIRTEFGARADFDAAIAFTHPEARERQESTAKQTAYRGAAGVRGISVEVILVTFFVRPSPVDPRWCDTSVLNSYIGLRRTRPGAHFEFSTFQEGRGEAKTASGAEKGEAGSRYGEILQQFCSPKKLPLEVSPVGHKMRYVMTDHGIGQSSSIDIVTREFYQRNHPRERDDAASPSRWFFAIADQPAVLMVFDMFVHRDVWEGCEPELVMYDTTVKGLATPSDDTREGDRLDLCERFTPLATHRHALRIAEVPAYTDILGHMGETEGWDLEDFRGYRTRISYPFHGSQVCMIFRPFETAGAGG